jgi:type IV pilus assembly protein PilY1
MKRVVQLTSCAVALGTLLAATASQATDIAQLPLKASVLAKPNVIFGMDDSGSMDWEVLLDTNSGVVYWNGVTSWDSTAGKPLRYDGTFVPYAYLIPMGTSTGGQIYAYNSWYGQAIAPTTQFAWLRSAKYNPIYYDSTVTYPAWSDAYFSGALQTYSQASASAAKGHPAVSSPPTLDLATEWTSSDSRFDDNGYMFYVQAGMILPVGAYVRSTAADATGAACSGDTWRTLTAEQTVASGRACWAGMPYYPATFWVKEDCVVPATANVATDNCTNAPDGGTLKRYEIKSTTASYPSGRSYADELNNFANWFQYYRKRKLMLAGSMGRVLDQISGLRLGVVPFNENPTVTMYDADSTDNSANRRRAAGHFYLNSMSANGTPTHQNIKNIANQYETNTGVVQYACQRNSMFIVTDGFSNTTSIAVPAYDATLYGNTTPYATTAAGSLADLALAYYTNRLRSATLAAGKVPVSTSTEANADKNPDLHINTYAITLGVRGSLWPNTVDPFVTAPTWTAPVANDPSMIDDQWHGAINGRGKMYLATTPDETAENIRAGLDEILRQGGGQASVAVSTVNLARGDSRAYLGAYDPAGWSGDFFAQGVDVSTGQMSAGAPVWRAGDLLDARDWTTRVIGTNSGGGKGFTEANVGSTVNPSGTYGNTTEVMNYLRGDRSKEVTKFRRRTGVMGAVINSEPAVDRENGVAYVASGEGMLHAFDIKSPDFGKELWGYVPGPVLSTIGATVAKTYIFKPKLDGTPVVGKVSSSKKLLVSGAGAAGRFYFAIDVTSPRTMTEAGFSGKVWEFPTDATTKSKMGQTLGRPVIVNTAAGYRVLVTSGYNNTYDGKGRLWVLNPDDGSVVKEYVTSDGSLAAEAGLAQVSPFGEADGKVRYVYGGDLLGNLWRFDLTLGDTDSDAVKKVAQLKDGSGSAQPVTAAPELLYYSGKRIVFVGTGRLLDISDFGSSAVRSFYAIADGSTLSNARSNLEQRTYNSATDSLSGDAVDWATDRGWFVDLPAGEQLNTRPTIAYGAIAAVSNSAGATNCDATSKLWVFDVLTGTKYAGATFVSTALSSLANSSAVTALVTVGSKIVGTGQGFDGQPWDRTITTAAPILPGKNSWREIRR